MKAAWKLHQFSHFMAQFCQTLAWRSQKGGDKVTLKRSCGHKNFMEKWSCTSVALHCCCSGTALLLGYESSPTAVAMQCQTSSKVLPRQRENFATEMGELCFFRALRAWNSHRVAAWSQPCVSTYFNKIYVLFMSLFTFMMISFVEWKEKCNFVAEKMRMTRVLLTF